MSELRNKIAKEWYKQHPQVCCDGKCPWRSCTWDEIQSATKEIYYIKADKLIAKFPLAEIRELAVETVESCTSYRDARTNANSIIALCPPAKPEPPTMIAIEHGQRWRHKGNGNVATVIRMVDDTRLGDEEVAMLWDACKVHPEHPAGVATLCFIERIEIHNNFKLLPADKPTVRDEIADVLIACLEAHVGHDKGDTDIEISLEQIVAIIDRERGRDE